MKHFKSILLVARADADNRAILARAVARARRNGAALTVVDVVKDFPFVADCDEFCLEALPLSVGSAYSLRDLDEPEEAARVESIMEKLVRERTRELRDLVAPFTGDGVDVRARVLCGTPFIEITREVLRGGHDLVMLCAEEPHGRATFGRTSTHLMRKCPCPVWVIKQAHHAPFARILAPVDLPTPDTGEEALSRKILDLATALARDEGEELHILHAWQPVTNWVEARWEELMPTTDRAALQRHMRQVRKERLQALLRTCDLAGVRHFTHVLDGEPGDVIAELAAAKDVELIVMGTVCRTGIGGFLIGNTAEKVLQQVDCSVLTVKPDGFVSPVTVD